MLREQACTSMAATWFYSITHQLPINLFKLCTNGIHENIRRPIPSNSSPTIIISNREAESTVFRKRNTCRLNCEGIRHLCYSAILFFFVHFTVCTRKAIIYIKITYIDIYWLIAPNRTVSSYGNFLSTLINTSWTFLPVDHRLTKFVIFKLTGKGFKRSLPGVLKKTSGKMSVRFQLRTDFFFCVVNISVWTFFFLIQKRHVCNFSDFGLKTRRNNSYIVGACSCSFQRDKTDTAPGWNLYQETDVKFRTVIDPTKIFQ